MSSRLIFVNRFYWPDEPATAQLLGDLAGRLAASGFEVTVLASRPTTKLSAQEIHQGVRIVRISTPRFSRLGFLGKVGAFGAFFAGATYRLFTMLRRGDTLVCLTDPPMLAVPATLLCKVRGARCLHWIQDTYPEVAASVSGSRLPMVLRPLRDWAWRNADACVALGKDMASVPIRAGVSPERIHIIPNWAPAGLHEVEAAEAQAQKAAWGLGDTFLAMYSGNLGRVHALHPLLDLAEALLPDSGIAIAILGSGAQRDSLMEAARQRKLSNLHFLPFQPREALSRSLGAGDAHFVTLKAGCQFSVFPSKLYGISAIARPVVYVGPKPTEISDIIDNELLGMSFTPIELSEIATFLRQLHSQPALRGTYADGCRRFNRRNGGADAAALAWQEVLAAPALAAQAPIG